MNDLLLFESRDIDAFLEALRQQFSQKLCYINVGPVLLAINPLKETNLYNDVYSSFFDASRRLTQIQLKCNDPMPHIFAVARRVCLEMILFNWKCNVLFMGQSGSGKSFNCTSLVRQLVRPDVNEWKCVKRTPRRCFSDLVANAMSTIQCFTEATGHYSNSSSRATNIYSLYLTKTGECSCHRFTGMGVQVLFLERWRASHRRPNSHMETAFSALLQIPAAMSGDSFNTDTQEVIEGAWQKSELEWLKPRLTAGFSESDLKEQRSQLEATVHALCELGMSLRQIALIYRTLSVVLMLVNLVTPKSFNHPQTRRSSNKSQDHQREIDVNKPLKESYSEANSDVVDPYKQLWLHSGLDLVDEKLLTRLCRLLQVDPEQFRKALPRGYKDRIVFTTGHVQWRCDCIAAELYSAVVKNIVECVNSELQLDHSPDVEAVNGDGDSGDSVKSTTLSLVDMAGVEPFASCRFEQLCRVLAAESCNIYYSKKYLLNFQVVAEEVGVKTTWSGSSLPENSLSFSLSNPTNEITKLSEVLAKHSRSLAYALTNHTLCNHQLNAHLTLLHGHITMDNASTPSSLPSTTWGSRPSTRRKSFDVSSKHSAFGDMNNSLAINHFSGKGDYNTQDWAESNGCPITPKLINILASSTCPMIQSTFQHFKPENALDQLLADTKLLDAVFEDKHTYFIGCMSPNDTQDLEIFDEKVVRRQMKTFRVESLVSTMYRSYQICFTVTEFLQYFNNLLPRALRTKQSQLSTTDSVNTIINQTKVTNLAPVDTKWVLLSHQDYQQLLESMWTLSPPNVCELEDDNDDQPDLARLSMDFLPSASASSRASTSSNASLSSNAPAATQPFLHKAKQKVLVHKQLTDASMLSVNGMSARTRTPPPVGRRPTASLTIAAAPNSDHCGNGESPAVGSASPTGNAIRRIQPQAAVSSKLAVESTSLIPPRDRKDDPEPTPAAVDNQPTYLALSEINPREYVSSDDDPGTSQPQRRNTDGPHQNFPHKQQQRRCHQSASNGKPGSRRYTSTLSGSPSVHSGCMYSPPSPRSVRSSKSACSNLSSPYGSRCSSIAAQTNGVSTAHGTPTKAARSDQPSDHLTVLHTEPHHVDQQHMHQYYAQQDQQEMHQHQQHHHQQQQQELHEHQQAAMSHPPCQHHRCHSCSAEVPYGMHGMHSATAAAAAYPYAMNAMHNAAPMSYGIAPAYYPYPAAQTTPPHSLRGPYPPSAMPPTYMVRHGHRSLLLNVYTSAHVLTEVLWRVFTIFRMVQHRFLMELEGHVRGMCVTLCCAWKHLHDTLYLHTC
eukprot:scpid22275/ scgid2805/ Unconventional myosin-Ie; Myosin-Ic; Unconventional myosin 1E